MAVYQPRPLGVGGDRQGVQDRVLSATPPGGGLFLRTPVPQLEEKRLALEEEVRDLLVKRATRLASEEERPLLFRSSFFLAPKKPDKWRPILNLKPLNKGFIVPRRFRMETLAVILSALRPGQWATSVDLRDAYLHIPIHPEDQRFLAFSFQGTDYVFQALPFGLSTAPRAFTMVCRSVVAYLRRMGLTVYAYLDDWLIVSGSEAEARRHTELVVSLLERLGWLLNRDKSALVPSQRVVYLGADIDFVAGKAGPSEERVGTITQLASEFPAKALRPAREWLRLLGVMASLVDVVPFCRLRMRPLQFCLLRQYRPARDSLRRLISLDSSSAEVLLWWAQPSIVSSGCPFQDTRPLRSLVTDASLSGWGAVCGQESTLGLWSAEESRLHINVLELEAIYRAVLHWGETLRGHQVTVMTDNSTAKAYINRQGGTRSWELFVLTRSLLERCESLQISLRAVFLPGKENVIADALSRRSFDNGEWSLCQDWADFLFGVFGRPSVDLFASNRNHRLPAFCSRFFQPEAWAVDAFSFQWNGLFVYAFPPWCLLQRVLLRVQESRDLEMVLVAPCWPKQPWFPILLSLLCDLPVSVSGRTCQLTQQGGQRRFLGQARLSLSAWRLTSSVLRQRAFLQRLRSSPPPHGEGPLLRRMTPGWTSSGPGQLPWTVIPWRRR